MNKRSIRIYCLTILTGVLLAAGRMPDVWALNDYEIIPAQSKIQGSIKYTVLGKYEAQFRDFSGTIHFDPKNLSECTVKLQIKVASLKSQYAKLDRLVISPRLLNAPRYPWITFQGKGIERLKDRFQITGDVTLHGITKKLTFPFTLQGPWKDQGGASFMTAEGKWVIRRKDFEVIWNKILDQGGIIVGDHVTVDWKVIAKDRASK